MSPLEQLFALELEFQRRLRAIGAGKAEAAAIHTSYALQTGYERLMRRLGHVQSLEIEWTMEQFTRIGDARDVLATRDSLLLLFGIENRQ
jgi:hypothetical protein